MAVDKDKVLAAIELKFKGKSITKTYKESIAIKWAAKIDNDAEIDAYINDREDDVLEAASEADRRATEASKKANPETPKKEEPKEEVKTVADDAPEWFKTYVKAQDEKLDGIVGKVAGFEQKTIAERFKSDPRVKGLPDAVFKGRIPSKEEDFETAITELASDYSSFKFGNDKPGGTGAKGDSKKEATKEEIDAVMAKI